MMLGTGGDEDQYAVGFLFPMPEAPFLEEIDGVFFLRFIAEHLLGDGADRNLRDAGMIELRRDALELVFHCAEHAGLVDDVIGVGG